MYVCVIGRLLRISVSAVSIEVFATSAGTAGTRDLDILEREFVVVRQLFPLNDTAKSKDQYMLLT